MIRSMLLELKFPPVEEKKAESEKDEEMADLTMLADQGFGGLPEKSAPPIKKSMKILNQPPPKSAPPVSKVSEDLEDK